MIQPEAPVTDEADVSESDKSPSGSAVLSNVYEAVVSEGDCHLRVQLWVPVGII